MSDMKTFNAKEVKDQVVQWIRDWFEVNGKVVTLYWAFRVEKTVAWWLHSALKLWAKTASSV